MNTQHPVVLFDGVCNLCNSSVQFIIKKDKNKQFYFASLQGETGQALLKKFQLSTNHFNSFILVKDERVYTKSTAVLKLLKMLGGWWKLLYAFIVVPPFIRDAIYSFIAVNRYRWFGKRESCMLPTPDLRERFLL
ncbi:MAG: thiol-disulfide oxidoreductase DCC family protein [Agriterribacter sp.]